MNRDLNQRPMGTPERTPSESDQQVLDDQTLARVLRKLPRRVPPAELRSNLRVIASRARQEAARGPAESPVWLVRFELFSKNLMRPLAIPFAGGIFSTVVAFSMWLSTGATVHASNGFDIPIPLTSRRAQITTLVTKDPSVQKTAPIQAYGLDDVVVDVTIDGSGGMVGYTIVSGNVKQDETLKRQIDTVLLLTKFNPAKTLGTPVEGKIRLSLSALHSSIDVKG
jgi:hypothetical protein